MAAISVANHKVEDWPIENLTPYEKNAKIHTVDQVARIATSISQFGWRGNPIIVNEHGVIIAGHGRRLAAIELGMRTVPVVVIKGLSEEKERALRLADNRAAEGDIDSDLFRAELEEIGVIDLRGIFDDKELDQFTADLGEMDAGAFVSDMGAVVEEQRESMSARVKEAASERVSLSKAFGFKDVSSADCIHISRLMAKAEAATGMREGEALAAYIAALV